MTLLSVREIGKRFGKLRALDDVSFDVQSGTFHGLIGPNGSGKSTLLKAIAGAHFADEGRILFAGRDVTWMAPHERSQAGMSLKFQITAIIRELSVYDNMLVAVQAAEPVLRLLRSATRAALQRHILNALDRFRLRGRSSELAGELSHGEQQWLEIAMALARGPKLLLLDEPTAGMSPQERRFTGELLAPIKAHCAIVIVEHDLDFIRSVCDRLTVLDQGRVVATGCVEEIGRNAKVQQIYTRRV